MTENEQLLPEWYWVERQANNFGEELTKWLILGVLVMATFGLVLMFQSTNDGMKGNH